MTPSPPDRPTFASGSDAPEPDASRLRAAVSRFLDAVRGNRPAEADAILAAAPTIARADLNVACVLGEVELVAATLAADRGAATRRDGAEVWEPLLYTCSSWIFERDAEASRRLARVVELLLDAGASPNTAFQYDAGDAHSGIPALYFASMRGNVAVTRLLLERGADPNDGESIYHAAEWDRRECLELLLAHGARVSGRHEHWGNTPLYFLLGHVEGGPLTPRADRGIRWLLEHGADPEVTSGSEDETALHCAARVGRGEQMIELLVAHGADPSRPRRDGATPYALALRHGHPATAAALAARGADTRTVRAADPFLAACASADAKLARELLSGAPGMIGSLGAEAGEALAMIAERAEPAPLQLMLELGFPVDGAKEPGGAGPGADTPLHRAAWHGRPENVRLLLGRGARVNVRDRQYGCSALAWACHGSTNCRAADTDYVTVLDLLIAGGADRATAINAWGATPESMATPAVAAHLRATGFAPDESPPA